jgi:pyruvate, orthophosphate dikinase
MAPVQCARSQRVFHFGKGKSEGNKTMKELVRGFSSSVFAY